MERRPGAWSAVKIVGYLIMLQFLPNRKYRLIRNVRPGAQSHTTDHEVRHVDKDTANGAARPGPLSRFQGNPRPKSETVYTS